MRINSTSYFALLAGQSVSSCSINMTGSYGSMILWDNYGGVNLNIVLLTFHVGKVSLLQESFRIKKVVDLDYVSRHHHHQS